MKARAPAIPAGAPRQEECTKQTPVLFSGYVYNMNQQKHWIPLTESFVTISFEWDGKDTKRPSLLCYQKNSRKISLSDLKEVENVKIKDTFVRWQYQQTIYGVRFRNSEEAQKFVATVTVPQEDVEKDVRTLELKYGTELIIHKATTSTKLLDLFSIIAESKGLTVNKLAVKYLDRSGPIPFIGTVDDLKSYRLEIAKLNDNPSNHTPSLATNRKQINDQQSTGITVNVNDPLWQIFLSVSNLSVEEVMSPRASSIIETFVQQHGGGQFLRQVNDLKMSPQLADELNTLAGQVHAVTSINPPSSAYSTLERKKRRAPKPPEVPQQNPPEAPKQNQTSKSHRRSPTPQATMTKSNSLDQVKTFSKRKAPTPPIGKPPPQFVPPPPPMEPPPEESSSSPVGPLSPKSLNVVCENDIQKERKEAYELLEKKELLSGLEDAIEEENRDHDENGIPTNGEMHDTEINDKNESEIQLNTTSDSDEIDDQASDKLDTIRASGADEIDDMNSPRQLDFMDDEDRAFDGEKNEMDGMALDVNNEIEGMIESSTAVIVPEIVDNNYEVIEVEEPEILVESESEEESSDKVNIVEEDIGIVDPKDSNELDPKNLGNVEINVVISDEDVEEMNENKHRVQNDIEAISEKSMPIVDVKNEENYRKSENEECIRKDPILESVVEDEKVSIEKETTIDVIVKNESSDETLPNEHRATKIEIDRKSSSSSAESSVTDKISTSETVSSDNKSNLEKISSFSQVTKKQPPTGLYAKLKARTSQMSKSTSSDSIVSNTRTASIATKNNLENTEILSTGIPVNESEDIKSSYQEKSCLQNATNNVQKDYDNTQVQEANLHQSVIQTVVRPIKIPEPYSSTNHITGNPQSTNTTSNHFKRSISQRAPPPVKPKPKRQISLNIKRTEVTDPPPVNPTFGRNVSEVPGSRETIQTKHVGSLTFGFAKDRKDDTKIYQNNKDNVEAEHGVRPSQLFSVSNMKKPTTAPVKEVLGPEDFVDLRATNL